MQELEIRLLEPGDGAMLGAMVHAHADFEGEPRPEPSAMDRLVQHALSTPPLVRAHLAWVQGEPAGYTLTFLAYSSFLARPTLFIEDIFVVEPFRGLRIGEALLRYQAREALRLACGRLEWMVQDWNTDAIRFYHRHGARELTSWRPYRVDGEALQELALGAGGFDIVP
jgi:GNAT superfamily N-acetyltransferase